MATYYVYDAIRAYIEQTWVETGLDRFFWANDAQPQGADPIIAIRMRGSYYGRESIGGGDALAGNRWDEEGILIAYCLVQRGSGERHARYLATKFAEIFRGTMLINESLEFRDASVGDDEFPEAMEGNWYTLATTIDWRRMDA